jgi:Uncharacterized conserved protein
MYFENLRGFTVFCISLFLLFQCSPKSPVKPNETDLIFPGMHKIASAGRNFLQGANDSVALADEKPIMNVGFSYDFWLDTTEVTQKEYFDITGMRPVFDTSVYGIGDQYPVYYVSWFDAILFCNEKSKKNGLDTIYSYFGAPKRQNGSVYELAGVQIHYDRNGFRLPTEAEWEFAAREGTSDIPFPHLRDSAEAQNYAWYGINASNRTHPVGSLSPNTFGLYDMAGNVYEWTNDWKAPHGARAITNPLGGVEPDDAFEKIIKGGSFRHDFYSLRPSRRSATYPTTLSSTAEYVGFRCARGVFTGGTLLNADDTAALPVNSVDCVLTDLQPAAGTSQARLVFINITNDVRTLCYIDFSKSFPYVHSFDDVKNVNVPAISPNGKYVAYSTRNDDGFSGAANAYVRSLDSLSSAPVKVPCDSAYAPRWWVDPAVKDTYLIFTNSSIDNTSGIWPSTQTYMIKIAGKIPVGSPQVLTADGGFHDGRSNNGQFIVTSFKNLVMRDLVNHSDRKLFVYPYNGKNAGDASQVCNASITPDTANFDRCLFLDFGATQSTLVGSGYGIHEYIFMAEYYGKVLSWYKCPSEEQSWDYPEWSSSPKFAVACGTNAAGDPHVVYLLDLETSVSTKLAQGVLLANPFLWIAGIPPSLQNVSLDSLGHYNEPPLNDMQALISSQLSAFWQKHNDLEIIVVGDSHASDGVNPARFSGYNSFNMAYGGGDFNGSNVLVRNYVLTQCPKAKMIIVSIIIGTLYKNAEGDMYWNEGMAQSKGYNYDKNHDFWRDGLPPNFEKLVASASNPTFPTVDTLGYRHFSCMGWGTVIAPASDALAWDTSDSNYKINFETFKSLVEEVTGRGIHLLFVNFPINPNYGQQLFYSLYGPSQNTAHAIFGQIKALGNNNVYFHFYDAHNDGNHPYGPDDFYDESHLCENGAAQLSDSLNLIIHQILQ